jgi:hypothetical protein
MPLRKKKITMKVEIIRCCSSRYYKLIIKEFSTSVDEQASKQLREIFCSSASAAASKANKNSLVCWQVY